MRVNINLRKWMVLSSIAIITGANICGCGNDKTFRCVAKITVVNDCDKTVIADTPLLVSMQLTFADGKERSPIKTGGYAHYNGSVFAIDSSITIKNAPAGTIIKEQIQFVTRRNGKPICDEIPCEKDRCTDVSKDHGNAAVGFNETMFYNITCGCK